MSNEARIFGLSHNQIIKLRGYWLQHHLDLPKDTVKKTIEVYAVIKPNGEILHTSTSCEENIEHFNSLYKKYGYQWITLSKEIEVEVD
jgi:hypothetical protein